MERSRLGDKKKKKKKKNFSPTNAKMIKGSYFEYGKVSRLMAHLFNAMSDPAASCGETLLENGQTASLNYGL